MNRFNEIYPLFTDNPETSSLSDSELSENANYINELTNLNNNRRKKRCIHLMIGI